MNDSIPLKMAVTVAEMARMVGLSRARFYQLMKEGVFPPPKLNESKSRPFYDQELQQVCLEVRRKNFGVNGQVVLFYARRHEIAPNKKKAIQAVPRKQPHAEMIESLKALGLTVTSADVQAAMQELFPEGSVNSDHGEVVRAIFLHLKRRNTAEKVGSKE
jgi:predicted DNA-binding transcriptional regulator AlpA